MASNVDQSEIARTEHRGRLITLYQFGVTLGFCLAFWIGYAAFELPRHLSWQIPLGVQIGPAAIMLLGLRWCIPESPRWLIYRGRKEEADVILTSLRMKGYHNDKEKYLHHQQQLQQRQEQQHQQQFKQCTGVSSTTLSSLSTPIKINQPSIPPPIMTVHDDRVCMKTSTTDETLLSPFSTVASKLSSEIDSAKDNRYSYGNPDTLEMEYLGIIQDVTFERECSSRSYAALLTKGTDNYRKRILLGMGLHIMTQFTGINALL